MLMSSSWTFLSPYAHGILLTPMLGLSLSLPASFLFWEAVIHSGLSPHLDTQNSLQLRFSDFTIQTVPQTSLPTWPYAFCTQHLPNLSPNPPLFSLDQHCCPSQKLNQGDTLPLSPTQ